MKTSELTGAALDWAVAKCEGIPVNAQRTYILIYRGTEKGKRKPLPPIFWAPSANWSQGGPIIERENMALIRLEDTRGWRADNYDQTVKAYGPTPLVAAMRCYVASRLGDEVEIPKELT